MRERSWHALPQREGIAANKVASAAVWVIERVEEEWRGRGDEVADVLLNGIYGLSVRLLPDENPLLDREDKPLPAEEKPKAPGFRRLPVEYPALLPEPPLDV